MCYLVAKSKNYTFVGEEWLAPWILQCGNKWSLSPCHKLGAWAWAPGTRWPPYHSNPTPCRSGWALTHCSGFYIGAEVWQGSRWPACRPGQPFPHWAKCKSLEENALLYNWYPSWNQHTATFLAMKTAVPHALPRSHGTPGWGQGSHTPPWRM